MPNASPAPISFEPSLMPDEPASWAYASWVKPDARHTTEMAAKANMTAFMYGRPPKRPYLNRKGEPRVFG